MAIVLEGVLPKSNVLLCVFWAKGFNVKDIRKEIFSVYGGKYFSRKVVHNWIWKRGKFSLMTNRLKQTRGNGCDNSQ
jgi:hypothetical protein